MLKEKIITVFGSSRPLEGQPDYEDSRTLGRVLAEHGFAVCSGGYGGVMAGVSRGAKECRWKDLRRDRRCLLRQGECLDRCRGSRRHLAGSPLRTHSPSRRICRVQGRHRYTRRVGRRLGNAQQIGHARETVHYARRFLAAHHRARARGRTRASSAMGRSAIEEAPTSEANNRLIHSAASPHEVAQYLAGKLK